MKDTRGKRGGGLNALSIFRRIIGNVLMHYVLRIKNYLETLAVFFEVVLFVTFVFLFDYCSVVQ